MSESREGRKRKGRGKEERGTLKEERKPSRASSGIKLSLLVGGMDEPP
jgi:hypothetical protein